MSGAAGAVMATRLLGFGHDVGEVSGDSCGEGGFFGDRGSRGEAFGGCEFVALMIGHRDGICRPVRIANRGRMTDMHCLLALRKALMRAR